MEGVPHPGLILVSGPAASGKSRWAEHLAHSSGRQVVVLATGPDRPDDASWQRRLERHRQRRPPTWHTREVGGELSSAVRALDAECVALVDSLGTWVAAHLESDSVLWEEEMAKLKAALSATGAVVVLVSEETGWGVVPMTAVGGRFRDRLGDLQQHLAPLCETAWLVLQGRAVNLSQWSALVPAQPCGPNQGPLS
ncbi:MAG: hypothetical protein RLZZ117_50 [Cyanobacteriota bacterium]